MGQKSDGVSQLLESLKGSINAVERSLKGCEQATQECISVFSEAPALKLPDLNEYLKHCESRQTGGYPHFRKRVASFPLDSFPSEPDSPPSGIENIAPATSNNYSK